MDNKKSRKYLKSLFRAGAIPTDADFGKLIDSIPNIVDDNIDYREDGTLGSSICIGAGDNQVLMSFFQSLNQAGSDWTLQLTQNKGLAIHTRNRKTSVMSFDPSGNVGIGTDTPSATLDVKGSIQAQSQRLSGDLKVSGAVTTSALVIPGLGMITDVQSLRRIIGFVPPTQQDPVVTDPTVPTPHTLPMEQCEESPPPPVHSPPAPLPPVDPPVDNSPPHPQDPGGNEPPPEWEESTVPAGRQWQNVAGPYKGTKVLMVIAWVLGTDNRSVGHIIAVNIDGDPSSGAITSTRSYQGRPGGRISFRWKGDANGYYLQCRTAVRFGPGVRIHIKLRELI